MSYAIKFYIVKNLWLNYEFYKYLDVYYIICYNYFYHN